MTYDHHTSPTVGCEPSFYKDGYECGYEDGYECGLRHGRQEAQYAESWEEKDGVCLWWKYPIEEPPYVGSPLSVDWVDNYYTHFSLLDNEALPVLKNRQIRCNPLKQVPKGAHP